MKKIIATIICIFVILALAACGHNNINSANYELETNSSKEEAIQYLIAHPYDNFGEYYIDDTGTLVHENIGVIKNIHTIGNNVSNDGTTIRAERNLKVFFNRRTQTLTKYVFGEKTTFTVDEGYKFCGYSNPMIGYLFRNGTEVYAVNEELNTITKIAEDVQFVIDCQYALDNEYSSQPLFIMLDGSILSYVQNVGLQEISHEGGASGSKLTN